MKLHDSQAPLERIGILASRRTARRGGYSARRGQAILDEVVLPRDDIAPQTS
jgi:hypothetical protein